MMLQYHGWEKAIESTKYTKAEYGKLIDMVSNYTLQLALRDYYLLSYSVI